MRRDRPDTAKGAPGRLLLFMGMFLCMGTAVALPSNCAPHGQLEPASVRYVIDGDTVILTDGRHVRLIGLNAPEIGHDGAVSQPWATTARRVLQTEITANGGHILIVTGKQAHDHYGRLLATLYGVNGTDLGMQLISEGLAVTIAIPPNLERTSCYQLLEDRARAARLRIWKPSSLVRAAGTISAGTTGFAILTGRVSRALWLRNGVRLILDNRVWVWIPASNLAYFHHSPLSLNNHAVLVRGWLHPYHGHAEMVIHSPAVLSKTD